MSKRNCENKEPKPKWVAENFKSVGENKKRDFCEIQLCLRSESAD